MRMECIEEQSGTLSHVFYVSPQLLCVDACVEWLFPCVSLRVRCVHIRLCQYRFVGVLWLAQWEFCISLHLL